MVPYTAFSFVGNVFLVDRMTGESKLVSTDASGNAGNGGSFYGGISGNGRYVVYTSYATNLVAEEASQPQDNPLRGIFLYDRIEETTTRVSVNSDGVAANGTSQTATITPDGRFIAFYSRSGNLDNNVSESEVDAFIHDRLVGTTKIVSLNSDGFPVQFGISNVNLDEISISADGSRIAFISRVALVPEDNNQRDDAYVRDTLLQTTSLIGLASNGIGGNDWSGSATISRDGSFVVFTSTADNLVPNDRNGKTDNFIRDLNSGAIRRISVDENGSERNEAALAPVLSPDGRFVAYQSAGRYLFYYVHDLQDGSFRKYFDGSVSGLSSSGFIEYKNHGWVPLHIDPACPDHDGDNLGPDSCIPFSTDGSEFNALVYEGVECVDADSDGWGWQSPYRTPGRSCRIEGELVTAPMSAPVSQLSGYCIDTDGDGWGWDGSKTCLIGHSAEGTCEDSDGDGWGWNGYGSCEIPKQSYKQ